MRGNVFHNHMAKEAKAVFTRLNWTVYTEYCIQRNGVIIYYDLLAMMGNLLLGCQIETTPRHVIKNAKKANAVAIPTWFVVPTRKVRNLVAAKLHPLNIRPGGEPIKLLLPGQLKQGVMNYLPLSTPANSWKGR